MLDFDLLTIIVFSIPLIIILIRKAKQKQSLLHIAIFSMTYIYIVAVIAITIFPIPIQSLLIHDLKADPAILSNHNNFVPLQSINEIISLHSMRTLVLQIAGNILLFMPLGFYFPLLAKKLNLKRIMIIGIAASISIEATQGLISFFLGLNYKVVDIDDVLLNTIGTLIGYLVLKIALPALNKLELIINSSENAKNKTA